MKRIARIATALALAVFSAAALAASPSSVTDLASSLAAPRDACAAQAQAATSAADTANFKAGLDLQNAQLQAELDARVYGVGHGRRETSEYYLAQMQQASSANFDKIKDISAQLNTARQAVETCVTSAKAEGKAQYSAFKADKRHKHDMAEAEALMAAWLTNVAEVSTAQPQGSDASWSAWKAAKAHAEVSAL